MKRLLHIQSIIFCSLLALPVLSQGETTKRLIVKVKDGKAADVERETRGHNGRELLEFGEGRYRVVEISSGKQRSFENRLKSSGAAVYIEEDKVGHIDMTVNDPGFPSQWHLAKVQAAAAWDITTGDSNMIIAVLDSGVINHADLAGRILPGRDFVNGDMDPTDDHGHGTAVTGTILATGNNGLFVAGLNFNSKVLPVKVIDAGGTGFYSNWAAGMRYAADNGADIINMSISGANSSSTLTDAVNYAKSKGVILVGSAGNSYTSDPMYPAAIPGVIAVSATDGNDNRASWSSYGSHIFASAPGTNILTTYIDGTTKLYNGTSFSGPIVAGVLSLIWAANPALSPTQVQSVLADSCDDIGPAGRDAEFGYGRVNALNAVILARSTAAQPTPTPTPTPEPTPAPADTVNPVAAITSPVGGSQMGSSMTVTGQVSDNVGVTKSELYVDNRLVGTSTSATTPSFRIGNTKKFKAGSHTLVIKAYDAAGNIGVSAGVLVIK